MNDTDIEAIRARNALRHGGCCPIPADGTAHPLCSSDITALLDEVARLRALSCADEPIDSTKHRFIKATTSWGNNPPRIEQCATCLRARRVFEFQPVIEEIKIDGNAERVK